MKPSRRDARRFPMGGDPTTDAEYWQWRSQFVEGEPRATDSYTSAQLSEMGMVGLYLTNNGGTSADSTSRVDDRTP
jgi:hypothetical protein